MAVDPQVVAERAASKLKVPSAEVLAYATAAINHFANHTGRTGGDRPELPEDDAQLLIGCELLTMRMWNDTPTPSGGMSSFDDFTAGGFTPRVLLSHLDQYSLHLCIAWGVA
jgi:hypothetical protein